MTKFQKELLSNLATSEENETSDPDKAFLKKRCKSGYKFELYFN